MRAMLNLADSLLQILLIPFHRFHPIVGLTAISILMGTLMVLIYRFTSNQKAIRRVKNQIKIHFMEIRVYKEDLTQMLLAQKKILWDNFKYMGLSLKPGLVLIFLIIFILVPLNARYGYRSFRPEESFIVTVKTVAGKSPLDLDITLKTPEAIEVETPPLRLEEEREINWRLKAKKAGEYLLQFQLPDQTFSKQVVVEGPAPDHPGTHLNTPPSPSDEVKLETVNLGVTPELKIVPELRQEGFLSAFYNPYETPLPKNPWIEAIRINYLPRYFNDILGGWHLDWLMVFIVVSLGFGFLVKGLLRID